MLNLIKKILNKYGFVLYRGNPEEAKVALTFDDGPHPVNTKKILGILRAHKVRATFFVTGKCAEEHPEVLKDMFKEGHLIANHSYKHEKGGLLIKGLKKTEAILRDITGSSPRLFRPPWGRLSIFLLGYCFFKRIKIVLWSLDSKDFKRRDPAELVEEFKRADIKNGEIILLHDDYDETVKALPDIIYFLRNKGFSFATIKR